MVTQQSAVIDKLKRANQLMDELIEGTDPITLSEKDQVELSMEVKKMGNKLEQLVK